MKKKITVVTPMFNEEDNVTELCDRVAAVMKNLPYDYEHICIDNCSTDKTVSVLRKRAAGDKSLKIIVNVRNFGHIRSPYHAMLQATGDAVVLIAADLQDPPEMIEDFVKKWEEGFKTVMATKPESEESPVMYFIRCVYYKIIGKISEVPLIPNATGCGLFDKEVIAILKGLSDPYPYFRGLVCEVSHPIATVPFKQPRRTRGVTSHNFYTLYDFAMLGITKHSKIPLRLMIFFGFALACLSFLAALGYLLAKLFFWHAFALGVAPIVIGFFFFTSVQMVFLGILGEYIGSIQTHVRNLPHVVEAERINF
ncbi:dolichol monophosphate mannose synthase [Cephaloticoccus capnophilus]|uniref:Dolichol monophosphate mannose synthase n=1 Tax=Cephaloticoccus capnophilus TaxID=1548208 RepID=A0A139SLE6_9BACT|nr:glycosyltransferase family 2 protein [Cephaloticoccus capnophilus]KXU35383.1 dolichol monophosphate mannose synthase [Cephaloticoccus capnophilus]